MDFWTQNVKLNFQGFAYHVRSEHNMWHYYSYLVCLQDTTVNDLSAVDLFVKRSVRIILGLDYDSL